MGGFFATHARERRNTPPPPPPPPPPSFTTGGWIHAVRTCTMCSTWVSPAVRATACVLRAATSHGRRACINGAATATRAASTTAAPPASRVFARAPPSFPTALTMRGMQCRGMAGDAAAVDESDPRTWPLTADKEVCACVCACVCAVCVRVCVCVCVHVCALCRARLLRKAV